MDTKVIFNNKKMAVVLDMESTHVYVPRIYHQKQKGKRSPRYLIKCGCCERNLEIFYHLDDDEVEINGVFTSKKIWRKIFEEILK